MNKQKKNGGKRKSMRSKITKKSHSKSFRKTLNKNNKKQRFFSGGVYPGPPYELMDVRLDPGNSMVDSRQLPPIKGGFRKTHKQKGGFYGVDVMKSLSSMYPYALSNTTGMTELPAVGRLLNSNPITTNDNVSYQQKYLV